MKQYFLTNWKSNTIALLSALLAVPAFVSAITQWMNHQPVDWRFAIGSTILTILAAVSKDASTHSTAAEVTVATAKAEEKGVPNA